MMITDIDKVAALLLGSRHREIDALAACNQSCPRTKIATALALGMAIRLDDTMEPLIEYVGGLFEREIDDTALQHA